MDILSCSNSVCVILSLDLDDESHQPAHRPWPMNAHNALRLGSQQATELQMNNGN